MSKKFFLLAFGFFLILLVMPDVLALGITPGRTTFEYEPGQTKEIDFTVINSENRDVDIAVLVQGDLNQSISVSEVSFTLKAGESKTLRYEINIPSDLSPGQHLSEVVALQLPGKSPTSEAFIGAAVGVATQISIFVPFPGKYAEAGFNIIGPDDGGKVTFAIPILSRGDLDLARVRGTVDIFSSLNEKIETISTNEIGILSKQRGEIVAEWDSSEFPPGPYRAVANIIYDEQVLTLENEFTVGRRALEVQNIEVNDFFLGDIAKFEILVENKWNNPIKGAFAEMFVYNNEGDALANFRSATQDIQPLEKALIVAFWDTAGVRTGNYDSSLVLKYGDSSERQDFKLEVSENEINVIGLGYVISASPSNSGGSEFSGLTFILITAIVVLILINLLWFLILRKKLKK